MTLRTLYFFRIIFRLARMALVLFALFNGVIVITGLLNREFGRELLIYASWTALCGILTIPITGVLGLISEKITKLEPENR